MNRKQQGITLLGFVIVLIVVGFFLFLGIRLFPVYSEFYSAKSDLNAAILEMGKGSDVTVLRKKLERRFYISYIEGVKPEDVKLVKDAKGTHATMAYEVRKPLAYNLDFVAKFEYTADLP